MRSWFIMGFSVLALACIGPAASVPSCQCCRTGRSPGKSIDGFRFEFPCRDAMPETPKEGADCFSGLVKGDPMKTDNFTSLRKGLRWRKGKRYKVDYVSAAWSNP